MRLIGRLLMPIITTGLLSTCASIPLKDTANPHINELQGKYALVQVYSEGIVAITSDTNEDGKWDVREYYEAMKAGEGWVLGRLRSIQNDTNNNGTFEIYEFTWPEGMKDKIEEKLKEKKEEQTSSNEFFY